VILDVVFALHGGEPISCAVCITTHECTLCRSLFLYSFLSWFGILALIQSIVNAATIGPIVFFVGLMINEEALNFMPSRHYPAYIIGIFPSIYDWTVNISQRAPLTGDGEYNLNYPTGSPGFVGVLAWKRGALLVSMVWVAMIVMVLDRKWVMAGAWAMIGATFSVFGIMHVPEAGFDNFSDPTWDQCDLNAIPVPTCWDHAEQWMFFVAYLMLAATFALIEVAKKFDPTIKDEMDDESAHAFDNWFKDASKGGDTSSEEDEKEIKVIDDEEDV
jgi:AGZA family xanthine/uracil permease-like MFS transporter